MNRRDDLDRMLSAWMDDPYTLPAPGYLPEVLDVTRRTRQRRPGALERWLPMTIALRRPMAAPLRILVAALAVLLLTGLAVAGAALLSRLLPVPAVVTLEHPQGLIAFERDGAVWTYDPATDAVVRVADEAVWPTWSPDGRALFLWRPQALRDVPMVIDLTTPGSAPAPLSEPLFSTTGMAWGPDGLVALAASESGTPRVSVLRADEPAPGSRVIISDLQADGPAFRPGAAQGDPGLLLVRSIAPGGVASLELIDAIGDGEAVATRTYLRTDQVDTSVGPLRSGYFGAWDLIEPRWAPATEAAGGVLQPVAYHQLHDLPPGVELAANGGFRVHVFDGTVDRALVGDPEADDEGWPLWDPSGTRIAFLSYESGTDMSSVKEGRLVIMPVDGDGTGAVMTEPILDVPGAALSHAWSPDGTELVVVDHEHGGRIHVVDAATGQMRQLPITSDSPVSWAAVPTAESARNRSPVPRQSDHPFHGFPITRP